VPKQRITIEHEVMSTGPYSKGLKVGDFVFVSGQGPLAVETGRMIDGTIEEQTSRALENIHTILQAGGASLADVVKATVYLGDLSLFDRYNKVYATYFPDPKPVRTTIGAQLAGGILIQVDVIAYVGP
jgi:2-iminobutanoate/2-iminopropanoate deaminase